MNAPRARLRLLVVLCAAQAGAPLARAEPELDPAPDSQPAEALFRDGRRLVEEGKLGEGCAKFAESQKLEPASGTLLNLARCYAKIGRTASAWVAYRAAASLANAAGQAKREAVASAEADALELQLPRLKLSVPKSSMSDGLELSVDGEPWGGAQWNVLVPIDPGHHVLGARAPGFVDWSVRFEILASEEKEVVVQPLQELPRRTSIAPTQPAPMPSTSSPPVTAGRSETGPSALRTASWAVGGGGLVALGVGTGFALRARSLDDQSRADDHCNAETGCDPRGLELNHDALNAANIATVFVVSGAVLVAGGVTLYLLGDSKRGSASFGLSPRVGTRDAGLVVHGGL